jgi:kinesin family member 5
MLLCGFCEQLPNLFQQETALRTQQKLVAEIKEELAFLKEQEASTSRENKAMSSQLNELRLQLERLGYDSKESAIAMDILKEQNTDLTNDLEELRKTIAELRLTQKDASTEDKEKKKAEKMAMMMAKFDTVSCFVTRVNHHVSHLLQQGAFSEKEEQLRATLAKLDSEASGNLSADDLTLIRRQLGEQQTFMRETLDRLAHTQEENEHVIRRRDELEQRLQTLEVEYEELLGA